MNSSEPSVCSMIARMAAVVVQTESTRKLKIESTVDGEVSEFIVLRIGWGISIIVGKTKILGLCHEMFNV